MPATMQPFYPKTMPRVIDAGVNVIVNLGGINITGKVSEKEAKEVAVNLEREIQVVLEKISVEKFRR